MQAYFPPDPIYPEGQINTLHFVTIDLDGIQDKRNGEYCKNKLRVRWYGATPEARLPQKAYIENKMAFLREKRKMRVEIELTNDQRNHPFNIKSWSNTIEQRFSKLLFNYNKPLIPLMISKYQRQRYNDPGSDLRIALDQNIHVSRYSSDYKIWFMTS